MRFLWFSNAPWKGSGYGNQTKLLMEHLPPLGHEMAIACNFGLQGGIIEGPHGVRFYPAGNDRQSNDIVQAHADDWGAELIISLYDAWPLKFAGLRTPWWAWAPVDHEPVPDLVLEALRPDLYPPKHERPGVPAERVIAYSQHGQREYAKAGINADYIPHGVDTKVFAPGDKALARERLGFPADAFVVGLVGTNYYWPSRKCIPQTMQAFAVLLEQHPEARLYLHMDWTAVKQGLDIGKLARALGIEHALIKPDQYQYAIGFPEPYMVDVYRALDVLASPSMGEGFGIPILEAAACGTPAIVTDFSAMPEVMCGGWAVKEYDRFWEPQGAWMAWPHVSGIANALEDAHRAWDGGQLGWRQTAARMHAEEYDFATVVAPAWDKLLREHE
jgi:glycosyltransferase involved in cell wall biosynthesis